MFDPVKDFRISLTATLHLVNNEKDTIPKHVIEHLANELMKDLIRNVIPQKKDAK